MDTNAFTDEPPVVFLLIRGIQQPWEPCQWDAYLPAVIDADVNHRGIEPYISSHRLAK
jgi:hypothetical protein